MSKSVLISRILPEELDQLSNVELAKRMDKILITFHHETTPEPLWDTIPTPFVSELLNTKKIKSLNNRLQRKIIYKTFDYLLQMLYFNRSAAASNAMIYDNPSYKKHEWLSVKMQITNSAINQWMIVLSKIAFEKFMDLIYLIEKEKEIKSSKSKFKIYKEIIFNPRSKLAYFAPYLVIGREFDREYRTAEVHGGSRYPRKILLMNEPDDDDKNKPMSLGNLFLNVWKALIEILNDKKPTHIYGVSNIGDWLKIYLSNDLDEISSAIQKYKEQCV